MGACGILKYCHSFLIFEMHCVIKFVKWNDKIFKRVFLLKRIKYGEEYI